MAAVHHLAEFAALQVFHRNVGPVAFAGRFVDRHDIRMRETAGRTCFVDELLFVLFFFR
jgi:hypothetical protein